MALDEVRMSTMKMLSRMAAFMGGGFGLLGIFLMYYYVYMAFSDPAAQIGWWATISIVLCIMFLLAYFMVADSVRAMERTQRLEMEARLEREERVRKPVRP